MSSGYATLASQSSHKEKIRSLSKRGLFRLSKLLGVQSSRELENICIALCMKLFFMALRHILLASNILYSPAAEGLQNLAVWWSWLEMEPCFLTVCIKVDSDKRGLECPHSYHSHAIRQAKTTTYPVVCLWWPYCQLVYIIIHHWSKWRCINSQQLRSWPCKLLMI